MACPSIRPPSCESARAPVRRRATGQPTHDRWKLRSQLEPRPRSKEVGKKRGSLASLFRCDGRGCWCCRVLAPACRLSDARAWYNGGRSGHSQLERPFFLALRQLPLVGSLSLVLCVVSCAYRYQPRQDSTRTGHVTVQPPYADNPYSARTRRNAFTPTSMVACSVSLGAASAALPAQACLCPSYVGVAGLPSVWWPRTVRIAWQLPSRRGTCTW